MKTIGGNSGYIGYSMSKRAQQARNNGIFPKTDFKKEYGISDRLFKVLEEKKIIYVSEWHHTSKAGNQTNFYSWRDDSDLETWQNKEPEIESLVRKMKKGPKLTDYPATREGMDRYTIDCDSIHQHNKAISSQIENIFNEA